MARRGAPAILSDGLDVEVDVRRCEFGGGAATCIDVAALQITVPAIGASRQLCAPHAGTFMLAAASSAAATVVVVREIGRTIVAPRGVPAPAGITLLRQ